MRCCRASIDSLSSSSTIHPGDSISNSSRSCGLAGKLFADFLGVGLRGGGTSAAARLSATEMRLRGATVFSATSSRKKILLPALLAALAPALVAELARDSTSRFFWRRNGWGFAVRFLLLRTLSLLVTVGPAKWGPLDFGWGCASVGSPISRSIWWAVGSTPHA